MEYTGAALDRMSSGSLAKVIRGDSVLRTDNRECSLRDEITWGSVKETVFGRGGGFPNLAGCVWPCIIWLDSRSASVRGEEAATYVVVSST